MKPAQTRRRQSRVSVRRATARALFVLFRLLRSAIPRAIFPAKLTPWRMLRVRLTGCTEFGARAGRRRAPSETTVLPRHARECADLQSGSGQFGCQRRGRRVESFDRRGDDRRQSWRPIALSRDTQSAIEASACLRLFRAFPSPHDMAGESREFLDRRDR